MSKFKITGLKELQKDIEDAINGDLQKHMIRWLEDCGYDFLDIIQSEITHAGNIDTKRLLKSFEKGSADNIWVLNSGKMELEIGTKVEYASYVNDGHFQEHRWIPGDFVGGKFRYNRSSDTGMALKAKFVEGSHYWDNAISIYEKMFYKSFDKKLQNYLDNLGR